jgi:arylformamidase
LCDFAGFYEEADRRTGELRARGVRHDWHVPYGPHPSQLLDVFFPEPARETGAAFVFLHGGGFLEGHPDHYGFLAEPFVDRGVVFVSAGYRLAPEASLADAIDDGAAVLQWLLGQVRVLRIDPHRIYVGGHSAGAMIWASLATRTDWQASMRLPPDVVAGAVLVSGVYDFNVRQQLRSLPPLDADDPLLSLEPLRTIGPHSSPLVIAAGSPELNRVDWPGDLFETSARALAAAAAASGVEHTLVVLGDHDHRRTAEALGEPDGPLFAAVQELLAGSPRHPRSTHERKL